MDYECAVYDKNALELESAAKRHRKAVGHPKRRPRSILTAPALVTVSLWFVQLAMADVSATVIGMVTEPGAAVMPQAKVVLRNTTSGLVRETVTNGNGVYQFLAVPVEEGYSIEVEAPQFRKSTQSGIALKVNQQFRADFQLEIGSVAEAVSVTANSVQVESASTQLGDVIEDAKIQALPLNGRSYLDLLGLQAGVVPINTTGGGEPISGFLHSGRLSVNGQREDANSFVVNGTNVEETNYNGALIVPTLDAVHEFRLLTNSFDAEYGHFSGAIVNAVTKSGTNELHGTAFEFLRNQVLDGRNFFDSRKGEFRQNQFGGVLGGPILKDRLFFFADYQGTRQGLGLQTGIVPTPSIAERGGDFSDAGTTGYAPLSGVVRETTILPMARCPPC